MATTNYTGKRYVTAKPYSDSAQWKVYDKSARSYSDESYPSRAAALHVADDLNYLYSMNYTHHSA